MSILGKLNEEANEIVKELKKCREDGDYNKYYNILKSLQLLKELNKRN